MAMYNVDDCRALVEEESYEKGCVAGKEYNGRIGFSREYPMEYIKDTCYNSITEIIEEIARYFRVSYTPECLDLEDWDEEQPGRIDLAWEVRTPVGRRPTEKDLEDFRAGRRNLYLLSVRFIVSRPRELRYEEIKEALEKERTKQTA